jgi:tetratricopeptide (TPR) repeat protein
LLHRKQPASQAPASSGIVHKVRQAFGVEQDKIHTLDRLWHGLGLLQAGDTAAQEVFSQEATLPTHAATAVWQYYKGVAAALSNDQKTALHCWQQAKETSFAQPWLFDNLNALLFQQISELLDMGDTMSAANLALRSVSRPVANTAFGDLLIRALHRGAVAAAEQGDWAQAAVLWEGARQVLSNASSLGSPRTLLHNLALAYEAQERWLDAAGSWRAMLRTKPRKKAKNDDSDLSDTQWSWVRGRVIECYKRAGAISEAVVVFRQAIKAEPDDLDLRLQLSDALQANGQEQAALNELHRVLQINVEHTEAQIRMTSLHSIRGEWYAAEQLLRSILTRHPEREDARRQMARLLLTRGSQLHNMGNYPMAEKLFKEGQYFAPDDYLFPLNLARIAIDQRKLSRAHDLLEQTLELASDRPDAYLEVIDCWTVADKIAEVRTILQRATEAMQLTVEFFVDLGVLILSRKTVPSGSFDIFGGQRPTSAKAAKSEWTDLATESFERAVAARPDDPRVAAHIASETMTIKPELALCYIEIAAERMADDPSILMLYGLIQGLNNLVQDAKKTLSKAGRLARKQGNDMLAQQIEAMRQQVGSPFFRLALQVGPLLDDFDVDDEDLF